MCVCVCFGAIQEMLNLNGDVATYYFFIHTYYAPLSNINQLAVQSPFFRCFPHRPKGATQKGLRMVGPMGDGHINARSTHFRVRQPFALTTHLSSIGPVGKQIN